MLFALKKIVLSFLLPPGGFILLCAILIALPFPARRRKVLLLSLVLLLLLVSLPAVSGRLSSLVETAPAGRDALASCDVIVLLGGGVAEGASDLSGTGALPPEAACRTADAARLWHLMHRPIIACGGSVAGSSAEAAVAARFLGDLGVSGDAIIQESLSRDTEDNAVNAVRIMRAKGFSRPALVTSAWHMRRAAVLFEHEGVRIFPCPSGGVRDRSLVWLDFLPSSAALRESSIAMKEIVGIIAMY